MAPVPSVPTIPAIPPFHPNSNQSEQIPLGASVPFLTPHAVSVSLPEWQDVIDYEEGKDRVHGVMETGYPRFFIHRIIRELSTLSVHHFSLSPNTTSSLLFPSKKTAQSCIKFLLSPSRKIDPSSSLSSDQVFTKEWVIRSNLPSSPSSHNNPNEARNGNPTPNGNDSAGEVSTDLGSPITLHPVFFPIQHFSIAKQYWQHSGNGICSRLAEKCLKILKQVNDDEDTKSTSIPPTVSTIGLNGTTTTTTNGGGGASSPPTSPTKRAFSKNRHYSKFPPASIFSPSSPTNALPSETTTALTSTPASTPASASSSKRTTTKPTTKSGAVEIDQEDEMTNYVEERYGRNMNVSLAPQAKLILRKRIAGCLGDDNDCHSDADNGNNNGDGGNGNGQNQPLDSIRAVTSSSDQSSSSQVTEKDVYLFSTGMTSIFTANELIKKFRIQSGKGVGRSVCFGFPYTDTLSVLNKFGFEELIDNKSNGQGGDGGSGGKGSGCCVFLGRGTDEDLDILEEILNNSNTPPITSLFAEFPSNPLLRSPNLSRIQTLAKKHDFLVVIDETVGNFINVEVLPFADIIVSSLTKVFSGDSNVMGGSLILNPAGKYYEDLKRAMDGNGGGGEQEEEGIYEDNYWDEDAVYMERNSRDFKRRIDSINKKAEAICDFLQSKRRYKESEEDRKGKGKILVDERNVVKEVFYPKYNTPEYYTARMRPPPPSSPSSPPPPTPQNDRPLPGYGGLFSLTFTSLLSAQTFFNNFPFAKGPSLGTNFTLACPYAVLVHWAELEWADGYGVEESMVRIAVGLEEEGVLMRGFVKALEMAENADWEEREKREKERNEKERTTAEV